MAVLALDTSAAVSVALLTDDGTQVLAARAVDERRRHAEQLTPLIAEVLAEAGLAPSDLTAIAVGTGPAPFTGLRVGLVTARTLGFALGLPVWGVPGLDVIAAQASAQLHPAPGAEMLVATDARRKEVYWARYLVTDMGAKSIRGPEVGKADAVALDEVACVAGEGAVLYPDSLPLTPGAPLLVDAAILGRLAIQRAASGQEQPTEPLYLRRPDVQQERPAPALAGGTS